MGQRILIVEDDAGWRSEIVGVLSGYEVAEASSVQEAYLEIDEAHSKGLPIDLVILDLGLSATTGIDSGLAVLAHLKERMPEVPCIVFTGRELPMGTAASLFEEYHIFKGLEKPRDMPRLAQVVRAALAQGDTITARCRCDVAAVALVPPRPPVGRSGGTRRYTPTRQTGGRYPAWQR